MALDFNPDAYLEGSEDPLVSAERAERAERLVDNESTEPASTSRETPVDEALAEMGAAFLRMNKSRQ